MKIQLKKSIFTGFIFTLYFTKIFGETTTTKNFYTVNIDTNRILNEVRPLAKDLIHYSETAQLDSFMRRYAETPDFLAVSADGMIRNYKDFKKICKDYYDSLREQKLTTTHEIFHVLDDITVILCWSGN